MPNFNRAEVYGRAYQLVEIKSEFMVAIECGVGSKFAGVVVENDNISKLLLNRKSFSQFVNFLPLNKLKHRVISDHQIRAAEDIARRHNAQIFKPWDITISSPKHPRFTPVHMFCFGGFLICNNMDAASEISTHKDCRVQVVTVAGDVFDPTGEIAGGFRSEMNTPSRRWFLYQELKRQRDKAMSAKEKSHAELEDELQSLKLEKDKLLQARDQFAKKGENLDKIRRKIQSYRGQLTLDGSTKHATQLPIYQRKRELDAEECLRLENEIKSTQEMLNSLKKGKDVKSMFREKLNHLESEEMALKTEYEKAIRIHADKEAQIEMDQIEVEKIKARINSVENDVNRINTNIEERLRQIRSEEFELERMLGKLEDLNIKQTEIAERDEAFKKQKKDVEEKMTSAKDNIAQFKNQVKDLSTEIEKSRETLAGKDHLLSQPFRENQQLDSENLQKLETEIKEINTKVFELSKQINKDAESTTTRLQEQMQDLMGKQNILNEDKEQIYTNLDNLDDKSQQSVLECFEFVNK